MPALAIEKLAQLRGGVGKTIADDFPARLDSDPALALREPNRFQAIDIAG
jgi:hypothetical protein